MPEPLDRSSEAPVRPSHVPASPLLDRYGLALLLVVLTILVEAFVASYSWGRVAAIATESLTLLFIMKASNVGTRRIRQAATLLAIALASSVAAVVLGGRPSGWMPHAIGALLALVAPVAIVRRLQTHDRVTPQTVLGALCLYLIAGLFFAFLFAAIGIFDGRFFMQQQGATSADYVYFSFVTLATVGYGDLTARIDLARMLAVTEALLGQLYLVSVVALLVSNIGRARSPRSTRADRRTSATAAVPSETRRRPFT